MKPASMRLLSNSSTRVNYGWRLLEDSAQQGSLTGTHETSQYANYVCDFNAAFLESFINDFLGLVITERN